MTAGAADASSTLLGERGIDALRLARLLIRYRLRFLWNGVRARGRGRFPTLVVIVGLFTSFSYVGLFAQSFGVICARTNVAGQVTALAVVALTIAFGSFTAKAASSEAVLAGSPENEFLLARPVALPTLVVARCLAESATDPLGALFLLPVLLAATLTWGLPRWAVAMAAVVSMLVQLGIAGLAQATQISVVRFVPRARRRAAWMALRLLAALSLAALWMMGTRVLRAPATLATSLPPLGPYVSLTPGALVVRPFAALLRGDTSGAFVALALLAATTFAAVWLAARVARFAGMQGWEEAGATWADAAVRPRAANARHLTAATKDLALITRDRAQLLALVAMPIIFVGVQLFGALGWKWSTASLERISFLSFSLSLYMATIGPLAHMQAERRAFWILRTVPVSVGRLLAAKARAWSIVVGALALAVYAFMSLGAPHTSVGAWLGTAFIVVAGGVGMTWLAIALAAGAADLSDDQRPAIGPGTIYTFLFVGGLYNVVLAGDLGARVRGFILYAFAIAAYWHGGVRQATVCLDAEAARERRLTLGDGATFLIALALGQRATAALITYAGGLGDFDVRAINLGIALVVGLFVALYLWRRPAAVVEGSRMRAVAIALASGLAAGGLAHAQGFPGALPRAPRAWVFLLLLPLAEELLFRGVIQRGVAELLEPRPDEATARSRHSRAALVSAVVSVVLAVVASGAVGAAAVGILLALNTAAALTRATTGRVSAAFLTRIAAVTLAVALAR